MGNVNIIKSGLRQTVSRQAFERMYAPNGWAIDETEIPLDAVQETVKTLANEHEVKEFFAMRKRVPKQFNDNLFKSESGS